MKSIKVTVYRYNRADRCWNPTETHRSQSPRRAEQWASERLGVAYDTPYGFKFRKLDYAEIQPRKPGKKPRAVSQRREYIPSVGDVGFW